VSACAGFHAAAAEWLLERRPIEDMPGEAVNALAAGCDGPALRQLAGMEGAAWSELTDVLRRAILETGGPATRTAAQAQTADRWLERLAAGELGSSTELLATLAELGGDYDWFERAARDIDVLEAMEDDAERDAALRDMRERAKAVLARSPAERLAAPVLPARERPFFVVEEESEGVIRYGKRPRR
jgi:hypothetical protein